MKRKQPATKRQLDIDLGSIRVDFAGEGSAPLSTPVLAYVAVRLVAKLVTTFLPMSATMAFVTTIFWFAAALYLFVVVTWQRDDNWLAAGLLIAGTFLGGGVIADAVGRVLSPGSFGDAVLGVGGSFIQMLIRAVLIAPLSGGAVAGARWLTSEVRRSEA
jgi:hypothetical protein